MNNVIDLKGNCSGCGACSAICPNQAIKYELNEEGFYSVKIIEEKCIQCGLCKKVCYKNIENDNNQKNIEKGILISARTKNEELLKQCTSGAIAFEIGKYGIENGYKIVGVIYDTNEQIAKTIVTDDIKEFEKIRGSKYIQSKSDDAIKKVLKIAKDNQTEKFIIFGTPCQIYGYRKAIEESKLKNEFIYIELFCHGVPSYLTWKKYLDEKKEKDKIKQVEFRSKKYGWHNFVIKIERDKSKYYKAERDNFYKMFFDNVLLNKSCLDCKLRKEKSYADIRLGDFWGKRYAYNIKGISAVLILTPKGEEIINKISNSIEVLEKNVDINECIKYQSTENYTEKYDRTKIVKELKTNQKLSKIIKNYRKNFSKKYRLKCKAKEIISYLPSKVKIKIAAKMK